MTIPFKLWAGFAGLLLVTTLSAQTIIPLTDMSYWKATTAANWRIAGKPSVSIVEDDMMTAEKGTGILVNLPDAKNRSNLISTAEYGDVEVQFDFMMAKHSNSGFYLQGRYEVQLLDSWGHDRLNFGDCGGIFARRKYDPGEILFEGHAPRQNACLAPGLWQTMEISFRAPQFDASGKKIANARIIYVRLNGITVQENVTLTGPTGGPISEQEVAKGPFMIQGDHGPVAFRNFQVRPLAGEAPKAGPVSFEVIYGNFRNPEEFQGRQPDLTGTHERLTWESARKENGFAITSRMNLEVNQSGKYKFTLQAGGNNRLVVAGKEVLERVWTWAGNQRSVEVDLIAGSNPVEILYYKMDEWMPPMLALWVESPEGARGTYHSFSSTLALTPANPIYLDAATPKVFRSFVDYQEDNTFKKRIVHAVNTGHPDGLHYTYNLDNGAVAQVWKGEFLNTSPMWDNRGDGSSQARGVTVALGDYPVLMTSEGLFDTSALAPEAAGFRTLGYDLESGGLPVFRYRFYAAEINDRLQIVDRKGFKRTLETIGAPSATPLFCRLAIAATIEKVDKDLYAIGDRAYYIQLPKGTKAQIVERNGLTVLYVPFTGSVGWSILF